MKHQPLRAVALLLITLFGAGYAFASGNESIRISPFTAQFLLDVEGYRKKSGKAGKAAAASLNKSADQLYKKKKYAKARTYYWNSFPNFPNTYAYLMSGDTHWRAVVQYHQTSTPDLQGCHINNKHFTSDLELDISNHYERGLALAEKDNDQAMLQSDFYKHAYRSGVCLQALADFYKTRPKTECIDIAKIAACLGEPLLK